MDHSEVGAAVPVDGPGPSGVVQQPRYCIQCGYSLLGLPVTGQCPECGTAVELSLREPWLSSCSTTYLESLRKGFSLVLNAILLMVASTVVMFGVTVVMRGTPGAMAIFQIVNLVVSLGISIMLYLGYWHATTPDPSQVAMETSTSARNVVRIAVIAMMALGLIQIVVAGISLSGTGPGVQLMTFVLMGLGVAGMVAWAVQYFAMMRYLRWLASRVPDAYIIARTKRYMWLLPVLTTVGMFCFLLGPLLALVMYWNLLQRFHKHVKAILATGRPMELPGM
jgi:hypothetical protein